MSSKFIPGIASQSLGAPGKHGIKEKLEAAATAGMKSVEIFEEDLIHLCQQTREDTLQSIAISSTQPYQSTIPDELKLVCARQIREWCAVNDLKIICLQPFKFFEGLTQPAARQARFRDLELWIQIAENLGTDLIQIPSNFLPRDQCTGDRAALVSDLRAAADMGLTRTPAIRFAHEALCWGTHTDTWEQAWAIVEAVDRPNFGTCLDTFNIAGRVYADPTSPDGKNATADMDIETSIENLRIIFASPAKLQKIFYVELCDGERLSRPVDPTHEWYDPEQPARMTWSRNARLFPFETDSSLAPHVGPGYLPVTQIFEALLDVGYEGYISFEVFTRTLHEDGPQVIAQHAQRAKISWERCAAYIDGYMQRKLQKDAHHTEFEISFNEHEHNEVEGLPAIKGAAGDFVVHSRL